MVALILKILILDFTALWYVISTASNQVSKLSFRSCTWNKDGVMAFHSVITRSKLHSIKCLEVSDYESEDCKAINPLLCLLPCLEELSLLGELKNMMFIFLLEAFNFLNLEF